MTTKLTADLGTFISELKYADIPDAAVVQIKMAFADCIGVTLAGALDRGCPARS